MERCYTPGRRCGDLSSCSAHSLETSRREPVVPQFGRDPSRWRRSVRLYETRREHAPALLSETSHAVEPNLSLPKIRYGLLRLRLTPSGRHRPTGICHILVAAQFREALMDWRRGAELVLLITACASCLCGCNHFSQRTMLWNSSRVISLRRLSRRDRAENQIRSAEARGRAPEANGRGSDVPRADR